MAWFVARTAKLYELMAEMSSVPVSFRHTSLLQNTKNVASSEKQHEGDCHLLE